MTATGSIHQKVRSQVVIKYLLWIIFAGIFIGLFVQINHRINSHHSGDFRHFYFAAGALLDHRDLYGPVPLDVVEKALRRPALQVERDWYTVDTERYLYPPMIAMFYTPIARLKFETAQQIMLIVNSFLIVAGILLTARVVVDRFDLKTAEWSIAAIALLGTLLNLDKVHVELQMFQTNALMFFLFALSLHFLDRKPIVSGIPLGIIFNIKYLSLGMLPWLVVRRRWGAAISCFISTVAFAFLPAIISGWQANLNNLQVAYGGLLHMVGVSQGAAEQANVDKITDLLSCSITSAMARTPLNGGSLQIGLIFTACIALLTFATVVWLYRRRGIPLFLWPPFDEQKDQPWKAMIGVEFISIIAVTLCFSPQTNTRHLMLMVLLTIALSALILCARVRRWSVVLGAIVLAIGFIFPPGGQADHSHRLERWWFGIGGQCWCLLFAIFTLIDGVGVPPTNEKISSRRRDADATSDNITVLG